jgi:hypothetical protein
MDKVYVKHGIFMSPQIHMLKPRAPIWWYLRQGVWEVQMSSYEWGPYGGITVPIKRGRECWASHCPHEKRKRMLSFLPLSTMWGHNENVTFCKPGSGPWQAAKSASALTCQVTWRTVRNIYVPSLWYVVNITQVQGRSREI